MVQVIFIYNLLASLRNPEPQYGAKLLISNSGNLYGVRDIGDRHINEIYHNVISNYHLNNRIK